jgi:hypothetical protein
MMPDDEIFAVVIELPPPSEQRIWSASVPAISPKGLVLRRYCEASKPPIVSSKPRRSNAPEAQRRRGRAT